MKLSAVLISCVLAQFNDKEYKALEDKPILPAWKDVKNGDQDADFNPELLPSEKEAC